MGFALRFAQQTSGEVAGALAAQCLSRCHPSGLREREVRSTIVDIKGGFRFARGESRKLKLKSQVKRGKAPSFDAGLDWRGWRKKREDGERGERGEWF